ncbi:MAG: sugar ABC transporter substrate-binding protein [Oscillospiraceae bacterium]|nr:sugar ABC transporter substrate-binding protein [Oscillospiraceae bacterium]MBO7727276.1 sugar ABC transporter substrate-binding protein [Oscillospiraceae bacterium]
MKNLKRTLSMALCLILMLTLTCVPAMAAGSVKIGVLVSDATSSEALAFRAYYTEYIAKAYDVEFIYSDELTDAAGEKSSIENFIVNNCKAVISFSSFDRPAQIEQCDAAGIYYAVATGTLTDEQYEEYKDYEYYVGAIGPSMDIEFQTGYDMAAYYIDQGVTRFGMFGGGVPYYVDMHIYRAAGMLTAMVEKGGEGANYKGADNAGAIIGQIYADGGIDTGKIGNLELVAYVGGYDFNDAWFGKLAQMVGTEGIEAIITVGSGVDVLGGFVAGSGVKLATVDSFTPAMGEAMDSGILDYMAGKFAASIGPIFAATYDAIQGSPIRDSEGCALALGQGFWVATDSEQFQQYSAVDSSNTDPAYTREILDQYAAPGVSFEDFAAFVSQYSFDEIVTLKK